MTQYKYGKIKEETMEVRFVFVNYPSIKKKVKATDTFAAASKAMELTCDQWPAVRPILIEVWKWSPQAGVDRTCYRVTKEFKLVEETNPYTPFMPKGKR